MLPSVISATPKNFAMHIPNWVLGKNGGKTLKPDWFTSSEKTILCSIASCSLLCWRHTAITSCLTMCPATNSWIWREIKSAPLRTMLFGWTNILRNCPTVRMSSVMCLPPMRPRPRTTILHGLISRLAVTTNWWLCTVTSWTAPYSLPRSTTKVWYLPVEKWTTTTARLWQNSRV